MSDHTAEIARLNTILNAGVKATATDGLSVQFDLEEVRKQRDELIRQDDQARIRSRIIGINFNGCQR